VFVVISSSLENKQGLPLFFSSAGLHYKFSLHHLEVTEQDDIHPFHPKLGRSAKQIISPTNSALFPRLLSLVLVPSPCGWWEPSVLLPLGQGTGGTKLGTTNHTQSKPAIPGKDG